MRPALSACAPTVVVHRADRPPRAPFLSGLRVRRAASPFARPSRPRPGLRVEPRLLGLGVAADVGMLDGPACLRPAYSSRAAASARRWSRISRRTASPGTRSPGRAGSPAGPGRRCRAARFGQVTPGTPRALSAHSPARRAARRGPGRPRARPPRPASRTASIRSIRSFAGRPGTAVEPMWLDVARHGADGVPDPVDQPLRLRRPRRVGVDDVQQPVGCRATARAQVLLERHQPVAPQPVDLRRAAPQVTVVVEHDVRDGPPLPSSGLRGDPGGGLLPAIPRVSTSRRIRVAASASTTTQVVRRRQTGLHQQRNVVDHDRVRARAAAISSAVRPRTRG